ncbi:MAG: 50S ribosomal protein L29 [Chloroflexi bacterium]|nr:50S ribosomal protein L29 [Chloroflexota bacterium]MBI2976823.1 50S ribosomal protein L29 [Chloroflexota bacterium]MBI3177527.1 50S ribosomal protein L29 [Chloroflexota bacterium]MBI4315407.1 50S ribosomal protein L29 [Chloroflexota bacterium]MBI5291639.1 50S ribosomal protein L29 [Chloroflexota bacterium]
MKISEVRALQSGEIETKLDDSREELFKLRLRLTTGQMTDTSRVAAVKQDVARYLTVLRERAIAAELSAKTEK